ncbi:transporter [Halorubellus sp. PRR65]|uniref:transporter n=2 Tax=Halobacteriales TaxID=2235 RepID=UPI002B2608C3|nr:transporter [Halorubellus sp. PRR65]
MCARSTSDHDAATGGSTARSGIDASTAIRGAAGGAAAFVATYVVSFLLWTFVKLPEPDSIGEALNQAVIGIVRDSVPAWKAAGYVLFNAQFVEVTYEGALSESTFSLIALADSSLLALAYLVPAVALVAAGYVVASSPNIRGTGQSAAAGALVVVGQLVLVVVGAVLFGAEGDAGSLTVPLANAIILAGVVYPVVLGAIGGVLADVA